MALFLIAFWGLILPSFEQTLLDRKREMIRELTNTAWSVLAAYHADERVKARARRVPKSRYKTGTAYLRDLRGHAAIEELITVDDLDVLMLRNDPSEDKGNRTWAQSAGIDFGRIAMRHGVIVVNDPNGLAKASTSSGAWPSSRISATQATSSPRSNRSMAASSPRSWPTENTARVPGSSPYVRASRWAQPTCMTPGRSLLSNSSGRSMQPVATTTLFERISM